MFIRRNRSHLARTPCPQLYNRQAFYTQRPSQASARRNLGRPQRGRRAVMAMVSLLFAPGRPGSGHAAVTLSDDDDDAGAQRRRISLAAPRCGPAAGRARAAASRTAASAAWAASRWRRRRLRRPPSPSSACSTSPARPGTRRSARPGEGSGCHILH